MRGLLPSLPARDSEERHRAATQLELLFDLVSVIAIAAVTAGLDLHRFRSGFLRAILAIKEIRNGSDT
jgi:low temperature requirement protein LtrA